MVKQAGALLDEVVMPSQGAGEVGLGYFWPPDREEPVAFGVCILQHSTLPLVTTASQPVGKGREEGIRGKKKGGGKGKGGGRGKGEREARGRKGGEKGMWEKRGKWGREGKVRGREK